MKPTLLALAAGLASLLLAACGSSGTSETGPTIRSLENREATLPTRRTDGDNEVPTQPSPELALENYRALLELSADEDTRAEAQRRLADLQVQLNELNPGDDNEQRLEEAITLYKRLIQQRPNDPGNDRVYYQLARAQQNIGRVDASVATLAELTEAYPNSPYAADGRFRRAELLFATKRFDEAATEYEAVLALQNQTPFFEAAQYKYAWTLYKLARYPDAIEVLFTILDRELPEPVSHEPEAALAEVPQVKRDLTRDVLRVTSLSYTAMGGGPAVNDSFAERGEPRFYPLVYSALGEFLLERERYSDAAGAYAAFVARFPLHELAPDYQVAVVDSYRAGGFQDQVLAEQQRYVDTYDPRADYWDGAEATETVLTTLRSYLGDLSGYFHARAQETPRDAEWPTAQTDYLTAAGWYQRTLEIFPDADDAPEVHFLLGETLLAGGEALRAAEAYHQTAYDYPSHARSAEAGYAAVLAYYDVNTGAADADKDTTLRQAVDEALVFAESFTQHPQRLPVLTRAAEDLYGLESYEEAISVAARVLNASEAPRNLVMTALGVRADSEFTLERYSAAEASYLDLLGLQQRGTEEADRVADQLALSIFRQAEAEEAAGNPAAAVAQYLRIGQVTPNAAIRANAEYDAAVLLMDMEDWAGAARVLEGFRTRFAAHELAADADKQLAVAYERSDQPVKAASAYARIAGRATESNAVREDAGWKAAQLFDDGNATGRAIDAYEGYVALASATAERRTQSLRRLIDLTDGRNPEKYRFWLNRAAGADADGSAAGQLLAAESSLALGRIAADKASAVQLRQPLREALQERRQHVEEAAARFDRAAGYGFASVTPAATHALASVYHDFARDLLDSQRPAGLSGIALDEYNLLLEDQAYPLEEQAIDLYEANLRRIPQGVWNDAVRASWQALQDLVPARYERRPILEDRYEALR
ncbi:MAG: tetratricopeptide repeat protein [Algiphilus sp.]